MKLNFGCGYDIREGWVNVDKVRHGNHDVADILGRWPYPDGEFDQIYAGHVLHMFTYQELPKVLEKFHAMLKPGGFVEVVEFDPLKAFDAYVNKDAKALVIPDEIEPTLDGKFAAYLTWYSTRRSIHTAMGLSDKFGRAGFSKISFDRDPPETVDRARESFTVVAIK